MRPRLQRTRRDERHRLARPKLDATLVAPRWTSGGLVLDLGRRCGAVRLGRADGGTRSIPAFGSSQCRLVRGRRSPLWQYLLCASKRHSSAFRCPKKRLERRLVAKVLQIGGFGGAKK